MKPYTTSTGRQQLKPSFACLERAIKANDGTGFCLACGRSQQYVEPDAEKYTCSSCDAPKVYGAEQLLLMGLYH